MEPILPTPNIAPNPAMRPQTGEALPVAPEVLAQPTPESGPAHGPESGELPQQSPSAPDPAAARQAVQDAHASALQATPAVAQTPAAAPATPFVANDDDLIEKEWVAKAKQIVAQTRDDPHTQERQVSRLQADYLKKRFGKDVKLAD